ncbi:MAG: nucleoside triphosphate pyrophosphohydrolase [Gemmatimonadaceae bacterium]|nr:nucleoside triphosphate pyrophosphohydrolase [Gemmatimonadaceae bacterium]
MQEKAGLSEALELMKDLRRRCDWDAAQTHESLRPYLIEEAYEVDDAIRAGNDTQLREELGDLLLQVLFHSVVAEERRAFDFGDVAEGFLRKMKSRHPHLYEGGERQSWEGMKARTRASVVDGLPADLPALHRAFRLQDRAAGVGFDWPDAAGPAAKVEKELAEVRGEIAVGAHVSGDGVPDPALEMELGDLLFSVVNLCRKLGVHPSLALDKANTKFARRFQDVELLAKSRGIEVQSAGLEALDELWNEAKRNGTGNGELGTV